MYKNILVPVAPDHQKDTGSAMAVAQALKSENGKITLLSVVEQTPSYVAQHLPEGLLQSNLDECRAALVADAGGVKGVATEAVIGHAGATILDYAKEHEVDLIVVASHRPGLQDYFLGSTAARVVRHAQCAVHVIR